jgi:hypothetical protein
VFVNPLHVPDQVPPVFPPVFPPVPPPAADWTMLACAVPFAPVTLYVNVCVDVLVVAGMVSVQVVEPCVPPAWPFFVQLDTAPQFDVSETLPPLAGIVVGDADSVQVADCCELQLTVMLP